MKRLRQLYTEYINAVRVGWFLAIRQLKRSNKGTTTLIIFIMVLTFLNLVVVSGLLLGLISGSFIQFRKGYSGDIIVTPAAGRDYIENSPQLITFLKHNPKVHALSPRHVVAAEILGTLDSLPKRNERPNKSAMQIVGFDPQSEEAVTEFSRFVKYGNYLTPNKDGYMMIGANLLKKYSTFADANIPGVDFLANVDVGSRVRITVPHKDGTVASKELVVIGVVKSKIDQISTRGFMLDTELKKMEAVNGDQMQEIAITTDPDAVPQLVDDIKAFTQGSAVRVQTSAEAVPSFLRDIETTMGVLGNALSSIALVVATITIFIVVFINAVTKRKFIGIMKGIGISPIAIQFSYVLQATFYGIVGSAIGTLLTFGFLKPFFTAHPIDFPFSDGILVVTAQGAALRILILMFVTILAGYIPAKLIVRRNTLDAILGR